MSDESFFPFDLPVHSIILISCVSRNAADTVPRYTAEPEHDQLVVVNL
jgi:hypothetical protein